MPKREIPRVFVDTNVWFSAFYGSDTCEKIILAHIIGKISVVISQNVLAEIVKNIQQKIPKAFLAFQKVILNAPPQVIKDPAFIEKKIMHLVDSKDQKIFVSVKTSGVKYFVTGNIKDFKVKEIEKIAGIKILTPSQAVSHFNL